MYNDAMNEIGGQNIKNKQISSCDYVTQLHEQSQNTNWILSMIQKVLDSRENFGNKESQSSIPKMKGFERMFTESDVHGNFLVEFKST